MNDASSQSPQALSSAACWAYEAKFAHGQRRRDLQKQLREAKDFIDMDDKRGFVNGLVAAEDVSHQWATDQRRVANSVLRIEGAIRDCSRSRHELMEMHKKMAAVVSDKEEGELKKKNVGLDMRAVLGTNFKIHHDEPRPTIVGSHEEALGGLKQAFSSSSIQVNFKSSS